MIALVASIFCPLASGGEVFNVSMSFTYPTKFDRKVTWFTLKMVKLYPTKFVVMNIILIYLILLNASNNCSACGPHNYKFAVGRIRL